MLTHTPRWSLAPGNGVVPSRWQATFPRSTRSDVEVRMKLSTRNQLPGTVIAVVSGEAMAVVKIQLDGGAEITSSITREAAEDLGLAVGSKVTALIKSTEVAIGVD